MDMKFVNKQLNSFIDSFKQGKTFLKMIGYDLIFYVITTISIVLGGLLLQRQIAKVDTNMLNQQILQRSAEELQALNSQLKIFIIIFFAVLVVVLAAAILAWSWSRGLMYAELLKKKLTKKFYWKFAGLNAILGVAAIIFLGIFSRIIELSWAIYLFYALVLVIAYFVAFIYIYYTKTNHEIFNSIGKGLTMGAKNVDKMILPCALILIVFAVLSVINYLVQRAFPFAYLPLIMLIIISAWARPYFISETEKIHMKR